MVSSTPPRALVVVDACLTIQDLARPAVVDILRSRYVSCPREPMTFRRAGVRARSLPRVDSAPSACCIRAPQSRSRPPVLGPGSGCLLVATPRSGEACARWRVVHGWLNRSRVANTRLLAGPQTSYVLSSLAALPPRGTSAPVSARRSAVYRLRPLRLGIRLLEGAAINRRADGGR